MHCEWQGQYLMVICHKSEPGAEVSIFRNNAVTNRITRYNRLQKDRDTFITQTTEENLNLFATKLIKMHREPFLDGNLSGQQRKTIFKKDFFNRLDFSDETLINTSIYTDKVFKYILFHGQRGLTREQQEQEFMKAVDVILGSISNSEGFTQSEALTKTSFMSLSLIF
ncbi:MAG: hypothetical protein GXO81_13225 [Chlorobi bacterium]|nr:hypothetical protein [Chlorobiota bacterium]